LVGSVLNEIQKETVAVAVVPSFTAGAKRAAKAAPIPVILTDENHVADAILNYKRKRKHRLCRRCRGADPGTFYKNAFWVSVGVGMAVAAQNLVKYLY